jgi:hypothetical protein
MKLGEIPLSRKHDIVIQEIDGEVLIYDLSKNRAYCLNQTSSMVWNACDGTKSVTEISQSLSKQLKQNVSEDIVWLALDQLKKDNLLTESDKFVTPFDGMNRREIVKRIGFASMVALPLISSVIAPTALRAQSGFFNCPSASGNNNVPSGCPCMINADCVPGCNCNPQGTATCCNVLIPNTCVPGNTSNLSAAGCPCTINANCVPGCNCNPQGTATCCNI